MAICIFGDGCHSNQDMSCLLNVTVIKRPFTELAIDVCGVPTEHIDYNSTITVLMRSSYLVFILHKPSPSLTGSAVSRNIGDVNSELSERTHNNRHTQQTAHVLDAIATVAHTAHIHTHSTQQYTVTQSGTVMLLTCATDCR